MHNDITVAGILRFIHGKLELLELISKSMKSEKNREFSMTYRNDTVTVDFERHLHQEVIRNNAFLRLTNAQTIITYAHAHTSMKKQLTHVWVL